MVPWNNLLQDRLGFNAATRAELARNDIGSLADLELVDDSTIQATVTHMMKFPHPQRPVNAVVHASARNVEDLKVVRKWVVLQRRMGSVVLNPDDLTQEELDETRQRMSELKAFEASEKDQDVQKPSKLKKMLDWTKFWESVLTYFGSIRGAAEIPLDYIFRDKEAVTPEELDAEYSTFDERFYHCTVLSGHHFQADNQRVWNEWKALLQDGPGWTFVKQFDRVKDGRQAILLLKEQNESTNGLTTRKNKAYAELNSLTYSGPRRDFTLENYITGHLKAHNELAYCGEPVHEAKKVQDFINGITDERLSNAKDHVFGDRTLMESFDGTQKYFSLVNSNKNLSSSQGKKQGRQVAGLKSDTGNDARTYSEAEWKKLPPSVKGGSWKPMAYRALTESQKADVKSARTAKKGKGKNQVKKRKAAAAAKAASTAEESDSATSDEEVLMKNSGEQFGRAAHKSKKNKGGSSH